jgi:NhaA family Na+:H+ antiporter
MGNTSALSTHGAPSPAVGGHIARLPSLGRFAAEYLLLLPLGVAAALVWVRIAPESYFRTVFALDFFVTRVAMVFFFGLVTKEIVEATAPGGVLHSWRRLGLPVVAAVGLAVVPALLLIVLAPVFGETFVARGWAVAFATDVALAYFAAILIFGRHPAVPFVLLLALSTNAFGFIALAPAVVDPGTTNLAFVPLMAGAIGLAAWMRSQRIATFWPYVLIPGFLSWAALVMGGVHPALALLPIVPFIPHAARDPGFFVDAPSDSRDALSSFDRWCRPAAAAALLLFGLTTGGVQVRALEVGLLNVLLAFFVGKPLGLAVGIGLGLMLGFHLPHHVGWRDLVVIGCLSTIGFTMALFFATVALGPGPVLSEVKMGALLTLLGAPSAVLTAYVLKVGRFAGTTAKTAGT